MSEKALKEKLKEHLRKMLLLPADVEKHPLIVSNKQNLRF